MKLQEIIQLNEAKAGSSMKGWLAIVDTDGITNGIEGIFVFKNEADADAYKEGLEKELDGSDEYATDSTLDGFHIVFHCDHRVDEDGLNPVMFDTSKPNLMKRLKASIAAGEIYGVSSFEEVEDDVSILKTN